MTLELWELRGSTEEHQSRLQRDYSSNSTKPIRR